MSSKAGKDIENLLNKCMKSGKKMLSETYYSKLVDMYNDDAKTFINVYVKVFQKHYDTNEVVHFLILSRGLITEDKEFISSITAENVKFSDLITKEKDKIASLAKLFGTYLDSLLLLLENTLFTLNIDDFLIPSLDDFSQLTIIELSSLFIIIKIY